MSKTVNSTNKKYLINCQNGVYKIGNITGNVPKGHSCILEGWHLKDGKIIKKGHIHFIPGEEEFIFRNSLIENRLDETINMRFKKTIIIDNIFKCTVSFVGKEQTIQNNAFMLF